MCMCMYVCVWVFDVCKRYVVLLVAVDFFEVTHAMRSASAPRRGRMSPRSRACL